MNPASQRSHVTEALLNGPEPGGPPAFVLRISATAGANPAKLAYLHRGLAWGTDQPIGNTLADYAAWAQRQGIAVTPGRYGNALAWERNDADLRRMNRLLFGGAVPWALRRKPKGWPEQQRIAIPIELDPTQRADYERAWAEFQARMRSLGRRLAHARVGGSKTEVRAAQAAGRAAQIRYRQKAGLLRAPHVAEHVAEQVARGFQVAVSCEFANTVTTLAALLAAKRVDPDSPASARLGVAVFTGQNGALGRQDRETERIAFQQGRAQVILFTPAEGFNLHAGDSAVQGNNAPRVLVVAEPRWSPIQTIQIEGRTQRNARAATAQYVFALDTIEERVLKRALEGMTGALGMMGDDTRSLTALGSEMGFELFED